MISMHHDAQAVPTTHMYVPMQSTSLALKGLPDARVDLVGRQVASYIRFGRVLTTC